MKTRKDNPKTKKEPVRRPVIESSRTADDVRRAEELIEKHGWEQLRDKK